MHKQQSQLPHTHARTPLFTYQKTNQTKPEQKNRYPLYRARDLCRKNKTNLE